MLIIPVIFEQLRRLSVGQRVSYHHVFCARHAVEQIEAVAGDLRKQASCVCLHVAAASNGVSGIVFDHLAAVQIINYRTVCIY